MLQYRQRGQSTRGRGLCLPLVRALGQFLQACAVQPPQSALRKTRQDVVFGCMTTRSRNQHVGAGASMTDSSLCQNQTVVKDGN